MRPYIQAAREAALKKTLDFLEREAGFSRKGKGGKIIAKADLMFAVFPHHTSREEQIQLHHHCILFNHGFRYDEKRSSATLYTSLLYRHKMLAGAMYQAELAHSLRQIGYETEQVKGRTWGFEIKGVPEPVTNANSKRRQQIEAALAQKGLSSAVAASIATLETRRAKEIHISHAEIIANTERLCDELGFSLADAEALSTNRAPSTDLSRKTEQLARQAIDEITQNKAFFTKRDVARYVANRAPLIDANMEQIESAVQKTLATRCKEIGVHKHEFQYTTPVMLQLETRLLQDIELMKQRRVQPVPDDIQRQIQDEYQQNGQALTPEQVVAFLHLTGKNSSAEVLTGYAGSGKGFVIGAAREAWERAGYTVIGRVRSPEMRHLITEYGIIV